jgi:hypothetical protein
MSASENASLAPSAIAVAPVTQEEPHFYGI